MSKYAIFGIILQTIIYSLVIADDGNAQKKSIEDIRISVNLENLNIQEAFAKIEAASDFTFAFKRNDINLRKKLHITIIDQSLADLLRSIAKDANLQFKRVDEIIHVSRAKNRTHTVSEVLSHSSHDRDKIISGKVTDESGGGLPGVSILVKGTSDGTTTDADGRFSIEAPDNAILIFSFVGYNTEEVAVEGRSDITITLIPDLEQLREVVVVGYGVQRKSQLTGSIASIDREAFEDQVMNSLEQGIQGRVAGVQVVQGSSQPGAGMSIRVRGSNSITGGSEPLYVIDGLPIASADEFSLAGPNDNNVQANPLAAINPNNIESIEILKDASATAIYGSRGSNGVILITTKRGQSGRTKVRFDASFGTQKIAKKLDVFNVNEFIAFQQKQADALNVTYTPPSAPVDVDWQDEIFRTAPLQNYNITASGGSDNARYSLSAGIQNQEGIIEGTGFDRYTFSSNVDIDLNDWLTWGGNLSVSRSQWEQKRTEGGLFQGTSLPLLSVAVYPGFPATVNDDGTYTTHQQFGIDNNIVVPGTTGLFEFPNPLSLINETEDITIGNRIYGNTFLNFQVIDGLSFKTSLGVDIDNRTRDLFESALTLRASENGGILQVSSVERSTWINENILTYSKNFGMNSITAVGGFSVQEDVNRVRTVSTNVLSTELTRTDDLSAGTSPGIPTSDRRESLLLSFLGRVNYSYQNKYLLTLSGRYDGSSKFATNNKWGFFPSAAVAWRVTEEQFFPNTGAISNLKVRASWGLTGNQSFSPYSSLASLSGDNYVLNGSVVPGFKIESIDNPNLKWEVTSQVDIGLDLGLLQDRFNVTIDYYRKETSDLILNVNLPQEVGNLASLPLNVGRLENEGIELSIDANILPADKKLKWNVGLNFSRNQNEVLEIQTEEDIIFGFADQGQVETRVSVGQPIGSFFGYRSDGIYNDDAELSSSPVYNGAEVGDAKFVDVDGDGDIDPDDRTYIGDPEPDFIYGITNNISFGNFSLDFLFQGVKGGDIWNANNSYLVTPHTRSNKLAVLNDVWTPSNTDAKYPKPNLDNTFGATQNDLFLVEDGSFFRLKKVTLDYNFQSIPINGIESLRLYFTATNLFTITDYTGFNPDVNVAGSTDGNGNTQRGVDLGAYPLAKSFIFGFNINF